MSTATGYLQWLYYAFGLNHVKATGKDCLLILMARGLRMFAYGTNSLILGKHAQCPYSAPFAALIQTIALFFSEIGFSDARIGIFMTLTLLGDVIIGTGLTLIADRVGRRKILLLGSALMILTGLMFALFENFWILLLAAIIGVVSATGGDYGPFRSVEESILSQLTTPTSRSDVLAWYVTVAALGSTLGSETSGRIIDFLTSRDGWTLTDAYHSIFWIYAVMGVVNTVLVLLLSGDCEGDSHKDKYAAVAQDENQAILRAEPPAAESYGSIATTSGDSASGDSESRRSSLTSQEAPRSGWLSSWIGEISQPTLSVMSKLWILLAIDSLSDGMTPYSLTNYYMDNKFHPSKATLGDLTSVGYFLSCIGGLFAGPLARSIGLINTMVFTHIPSSAAVLLFPFPSTLWLTAILLFVRAGLNNMDQAPRSALIAGVVRPSERTACMGITQTVRTLAATTGPLVTGFLAQKDRFWIAFVVGGACRLTYDIGLWIIFVNVKLHQHEVQPAEERPSSSSSDENVQGLQAGDSSADKVARRDNAKSASQDQM